MELVIGLLMWNIYTPSSKMSDSNQLELDYQLTPSIPVLDGILLGCDTFLQMKLVEYLVK